MTRQARIVGALAHRQAHLGRDEHLVAIGAQRLAEDLFGAPVGIDVGGVEQVDAGVSRELDLLRAPSTSIWPTGDAHPVPPKPIVPRVIVETRRPLRPSCRYSIRSSSPGTPPGPCIGALFMTSGR